MLEHETGAPFLHAQLRRVDIAEVDAAFADRLKAGNCTQQRGLAGSRRSQQREQLARWNIETDIVQRVHVAEVLGKIANRDVHVQLPLTAASSSPWRHSRKFFNARVTKPSNANNDATANAALYWPGSL